MQFNNMIGQMIGHYRIIQPINHDGLTTVFLAQDIHLRRQVNIKVFWHVAEQAKDFSRSFVQEAKLLAQLDHPNILPVYDYGEQQGLAYLVTPSITGGSLKGLLQQRHTLPPGEAFKLVAQLLRALQYAHEHSLIHQDVRPGNVLFKADGSLLLSGFGLVKVLPEAGQSVFTTNANPMHQQIAEAAHYLAPEQLAGQITATSDIYSVGIILYEMLAGTRPFVEDNPANVAMKPIPKSLREINPPIPPQLKAIVLCALEKDPTERYQQPTDFLNALTSIIPAEQSMRTTGVLEPTLLPAAPQQGATMSVSYRPGNEDPEVNIETFINSRQSVNPTLYSSTQPGARAFAPVLPTPKRQYTFSVVAVLIVVVLLASSTGAYLLASGWLSSHSGSTTILAQVPTPSTSCPAVGKARVAVKPPMVRGKHPNIVYIDSVPNGSFFTDTLKRYDVTTGRTTELPTGSNSPIDNVQISEDGQWILFIRDDKPQMIRIDGQDLQTLYCFPLQSVFSSPETSPNLRFVMFDGGIHPGGSVFYLLDTGNGTLQPELVNLTIDYTPSFWLDNTRLYMANGDNTVFLLDTKKGPYQHNSDLSMVFKLAATGVPVARSLDGSQVFLAQCSGSSNQGQGCIIVQPATGGLQQTIFNNPTLTIANLQVVSGTTLLLLIKNDVNSGDTSQNGLWKINRDGSGLTPLLLDSNPNDYLSLDGSNISLGANMYVVGRKNALLFGSLSGGTPTPFATESNGLLKMVGWAIM